MQGLSRAGCWSGYRGKVAGGGARVRARGGGGQGEGSGRGGVRGIQRVQRHTTYRHAHKQIRTSNGKKVFRGHPGALWECMRSCRLG